MIESIAAPLPAAEATSGLAWVEDAWRLSLDRLRMMRERLADSFPHASRNGRYETTTAEWWTSGFWPGLLWLAYRDNADGRFRVLAEACEGHLDRVLREYDALHHDVGFMWVPSSVARYKLLGADDSRRRALLAASVLAARFNLRGRFIRAWPDVPGESRAGWAIVDTMMNLPLLFWAAEVSRDARFSHVAMAHADTTLEYFVRSDGSTRHIVSFDPDSGDYRGTFGGQGLGPDSAWSRGVAWALYGFTLCHRYTGAARYREAALRIARFFTSQLGRDGVPRWDFRAPEADDRRWDSSAGACAASGMLELCPLVSEDEAAPLRATAVAITRALHEKCGAWANDEDGLLRYATGNRPAGLNVQVSLIYGDFFFLESLAKLRGRRETFW